MAILPIIFIAFGVGEVAKVMLVVLGTAPLLTRDIEQRVRELPAAQQPLQRLQSDAHRIGGWGRGKRA